MRTIKKYAPTVCKKYIRYPLSDGIIKRLIKAITTFRINVRCDDRFIVFKGIVVPSDVNILRGRNPHDYWGYYLTVIARNPVLDGRNVHDSRYRLFDTLKQSRTIENDEVRVDSKP